MQCDGIWCDDLICSIFPISSTQQKHNVLIGCNILLRKRNIYWTLSEPWLDLIWHIIQNEMSNVMSESCSCDGLKWISKSTSTSIRMEKKMISFVWFGLVWFGEHVMSVLCCDESMCTHRISFIDLNRFESSRIESNRIEWNKHLYAYMCISIR